MRSGAGSGRRLRPDARVRTRRSAPGCRRRSGHGGFGRQAAWPRHTSGRRRRRRRGGIWRSPTGSRSRSGAPRGMECARSPAGWPGRRRRSRGSCAATPPRAPAASSTGGRRRSGMRIAPRAGRSRRSSRSMLRCGGTCRSGWPAWSSRQAARWSAGLGCRGRGAGTGGGSRGGGPGRGAQSRLPGASRATSPRMIPCASATRPSTKRCMCRGAARCAVS